MFQRIRKKLLMASTIAGFGHAVHENIKFKPYVGLSTNLCLSTDNTFTEFSTDFICYTLLYTSIGAVISHMGSAIGWGVYKQLHNYLYTNDVIDTYIDDNDDYINDAIPSTDELEGDLEEDFEDEQDEVKISEMVAVDNPLQNRLDEMKFDGQLPNGALDVSTRDILNNPHVLIPCGHSHSEKQIQHFGGKCPCCRGIFSKSIPNHNLRQLLPEVVNMLENKVDKKSHLRDKEDTTSFVHVKSELSEENHFINALNRMYP